MASCKERVKVVAEGRNEWSQEMNTGDNLEVCVQKYRCPLRVYNRT